MQDNILTYIQDAFDFVRRGQHISGQAPIAVFERLAEDLPDQGMLVDAQKALDDQNAQVNWQITSQLSVLGEYLLRLQIQANPILICQRCLKPFVYPLDSDITVQLVSRDEDLDEVDESGEIAAAEYEKIVAKPSVDIMQLVEDELILSLPYVPRHEVCEERGDELISAVRVADEVSEVVQKPSPFAVLEKFKKTDFL